MNELFQGLKDGVIRVIENFHARTRCEPPTIDDVVGDDIPDDLRVAAHGKYIDGDGFVSAGDSLVGDIITHHEGEPIYELIGVTSVQEIG